MNSFLYDLKGQVTVFNGLTLLLILTIIFYRCKKRKIAKVLGIASVLIFLLCSTHWVPQYLAGRIERKYNPLSLPLNITDTGMILIHVLGSGYVLDKRLPATAQLGLTGMGRLAEAIRIHRALKNSVIICSGYSALGLETQAQVTKRAAIALGVAANELETLDKPATTQEEASELGKLYPKSSKLVVVTDALHMPRAIKYFITEGFKPIPAPTNYKINDGPVQETTQWWPSTENIYLMNYMIHEWLGNFKTFITR